MATSQPRSVDCAVNKCSVGKEAAAGRSANNVQLMMSKVRATSLTRLLKRAQQGTYLDLKVVENG